jgi:uncharacterized membrane protein YdjX (TVP38/TMEM64 family)
MVARFSHVTRVKQHALKPTMNVTSLKRWGPLAVLATLIGLAYALGLHQYVTLQAIAEHKSDLTAFVGQHFWAAVTLYALVYIVTVALSLPGAAILSIFGGFIFGWLVSAPVTIAAATLGAIIVFEIVKTSLGAAIAERAGPFVQKLSAGFEKDAFNYLLFLRLVPAFPFFAVNAVAGLSRVSLKTFSLATLIGIVPGTYAFAWLGRGLDSIFAAQEADRSACIAAKGLENCPFTLPLSSLVTRELLIAFALLGLVALVPVAIKKLKSKS